VKAVVIGLGAVGRRAAQALISDPVFDSVTVMHRDPERARDSAREWAADVQFRRAGAANLPDADVVVVAVPSGERRYVAAAINQGSHCVCATDDLSEVRTLLGFDALARQHGVNVAVGTTMAPGLSCLLAIQLSQGFDRVDEVHVASFGTGGPACARRHHSALTSVGLDWEDGAWRRRAGGSGRELLWFPEPVGGADCYRAALPDPLLLVPAFPGCRRVTARIEATRRDRVTSWLPMLRRPHPEGRVGAVRVEVRGWVEGRAETRILGAIIPPGVAAGTVSAVAARWAVTGRLARCGAAGLAELVATPGLFLRDLATEGVTVSVFEGG
jgi:saccharopine dehydrogenase-like NADP-dependent oxidoreductase